MTLENLLQQAKQQRENELLAKQRIADEKREIEEQERETAKNAFKKEVYELVGDILCELDSDPKLEPVTIGRDEEMSRCYDNLCCTLQIHHAFIKFGISDFSNGKPTNWFFRDGVTEDFSIYQRFVPPAVSIDALKSGSKYVVTKDLHDFLMSVVLGVQEEYDRLLPYFREAPAKMAEEEMDKRLLAEYRQAIVKGVDASDQAIAELLEESKSKIWTWPAGRQLEIFKISWCSGGGWSSDTGKYEFDYSFGYSLSAEPNGSGYYELLPMKGKHQKSRQVKPPAEFVTVERLLVSDTDSLPEELLVKVYKQLEVIDLYDVYDSLWGRTQPNTFLPEFFPQIPEGLPEESANRFRFSSQTDRLEIGTAPCLEIRLAIDPFDNEGDDNIDDSKF